MNIECDGILIYKTPTGPLVFGKHNKVKLFASQNPEKMAIHTVVCSGMNVKQFELMYKTYHDVYPVADIHLFSIGPITGRFVDADEFAENLGAFVETIHNSFLVHQTVIKLYNAGFAQFDAKRVKSLTDISEDARRYFMNNGKTFDRGRTKHKLDEIELEMNMLIGFDKIENAKEVEYIKNIGSRAKKHKKVRQYDEDLVLDPLPSLPTSIVEPLVGSTKKKTTIEVIRGGEFPINNIYWDFLKSLAGSCDLVYDHMFSSFSGDVTEWNDILRIMTPILFNSIQKSEEVLSSLLKNRLTVEHVIKVKEKFPLDMNVNTIYMKTIDLVSHFLKSGMNENPRKRKETQFVIIYKIREYNTCIALLKNCFDKIDLKKYIR